MNLRNKKILLTGASGGIGKAVALELAHYDCQLVLSGRNQQQLAAIAANIIGKSQCKVKTVVTDLTNSQDCKHLIDTAINQLNGLDILINLAGLQTFKPLINMETIDIESQIAVNLQAPIVLSQQAAAHMTTQGKGHIVNIGSTFGSIGFANFSVYSAAKFGLRGFSEALRRELQNTGIKITYVAPRATQTDMNSESVYQMAKDTGMNMDSPEKVAGEIIKAISAEKKNHFIGFPEKLFARINAVVPGWVDKALSKQNTIAQKYV